MDRGSGGGGRRIKRARVDWLMLFFFVFPPSDFLDMAQPNLSREFSDVGSDYKSEGQHREHVPHALTLDQILEKPPAEITHAE